MRPALPVAVLVAVVLSGCSSSSPAPSQAGPDLPDENAFAEGTCRIAAPDVRAVGTALAGLTDEPAVDQGVQDALRDAQQPLAALAEGAEPTLKPVLDDLVVKIGLVRIRAVGNSYEPALGASLTKAYAAVVDACTGAPAQ